MQEVADIAVRLAEGIREVVKPAIGLGTEAERSGVSGDWQYLVDVKASSTSPSSSGSCGAAVAASPT